MEVPKPSVNSPSDSFNISAPVQQSWRIVARNGGVRIIMPRAEECRRPLRLCGERGTIAP
jgi:hypothetical protein